MTRSDTGILRRSLEALFGIYAWTVFAACVAFALLVAALIPGQERRRQLVARAARAIFVLAGIKVRVRGVENLPPGHCIVVANHASYVDGILLKGYLPPRFAFVIKGEMRNVPVVHFLLRRAGSKFVERFESAGSSRDARRIVKAAQGGESLGFFPEGTFITRAGVGPFRAGAFMAAIKGGMPVVPIAIFGTRRLLPSGRKLPRPAAVGIHILPAIPPDAPQYVDSRSLAEAARQRILDVLDEPDLVEKQPN